MYIRAGVLVFMRFTHQRVTHQRMTHIGLTLCECVCVRVRVANCIERWGAGVETQKNVRGEIGGWGRVPFNETYAPSLSTIYDGA